MYGCGGNGTCANLLCSCCDCMCREMGPQAGEVLVFPLPAEARVFAHTPTPPVLVTVQNLRGHPSSLLRHWGRLQLSKHYTLQPHTMAVMQSVGGVLTQLRLPSALPPLRPSMFASAMVYGDLTVHPGKPWRRKRGHSRRRPKRGSCHEKLQADVSERNGTKGTRVPARWLPFPPCLQSSPPSQRTMFAIPRRAPH